MKGLDLVNIPKYDFLLSFEGVREEVGNKSRPKTLNWNNDGCKGQMIVQRSQKVTVHMQLGSY